MKCSNHFPMQIYNYNFSYTTIFIVFLKNLSVNSSVMKNMDHLQKLVEE